MLAASSSVEIDEGGDVRSTCRTADREVVELVSPRLCSSEDALAALRLSAGAPEGQSVVVLVCDDEQEIVLAVDFAGAGAWEAADAVGIVVEAISGRGAMALVVGVLVEGGSAELDDDELHAVGEVAKICGSAGISLLDVIVVADEEWLSVAEP